jgi:hypothetical protein
MKIFVFTLLLLVGCGGFYETDTKREADNPNPSFNALFPAPPPPKQVTFGFSGWSDSTYEFTINCYSPEIKSAQKKIQLRRPAYPNPVTSEALTLYHDDLDLIDKWTAIAHNCLFDLRYSFVTKLNDDQQNRLQSISEFVDSIIYDTRRLLRSIKPTFSD